MDVPMLWRLFVPHLSHLKIRRAIASDFKWPQFPLCSTKVGFRHDF